MPGAGHLLREAGDLLRERLPEWIRRPGSRPDPRDHRVVPALDELTADLAAEHADLDAAGGRPRRGGARHAHPGRGLAGARSGQPPGLVRPGGGAGRPRSRVVRGHADRGAVRRDLHRAGGGGGAGASPVRSCWRGGGRPGSGLLDALAGPRPVDPGALVRAAHERGVLHHRPADGDVGPRAGRGRRPGRRARSRRTGCGTSPSSGCGPSPTATGCATCPCRTRRCGWSWCRRRERRGRGATRRRRTWSGARRSTSASWSPSAGTSTTPSSWPRARWRPSGCAWPRPSPGRPVPVARPGADGSAGGCHRGLAPGLPLPGRTGAARRRELPRRCRRAGRPRRGQRRRQDHAPAHPRRRRGRRHRDRRRRRAARRPAPVRGLAVRGDRRCGTCSSRSSPPAVRRAAARLAEAEAALDREATAEAGLALADAWAAWGDAGGHEAELAWAAHTTAALRRRLADVADRPVGTLSGGEQKRLALEALLRGDDDVLLLDEPDNYLDVPGKEWLEEALRADDEDGALRQPRPGAAAEHGHQGGDDRGSRGRGPTAGPSPRGTRPGRPAWPASTTSTAGGRRSASASRPRCGSSAAACRCTDSFASRLRATQTKVRRHEAAVPTERPQTAVGGRPPPGRAHGQAGRHHRGPGPARPGGALQHRGALRRAGRRPRPQRDRQEPLPPPAGRRRRGGRGPLVARRPGGARPLLADPRAPRAAGPAVARRAPVGRARPRPGHGRAAALRAAGGRHPALRDAVGRPAGARCRSSSSSSAAPPCSCSTSPPTTSTWPRPRRSRRPSTPSPARCWR